MCVTRKDSGQISAMLLTWKILYWHSVSNTWHINHRHQRPLYNSLPLYLCLKNVLVCFGYNHYQQVFSTKSKKVVFSSFDSLLELVVRLSAEQINYVHTTARMHTKTIKQQDSECIIINKPPPYYRHHGHHSIQTSKSWNSFQLCQLIPRDKCALYDNLCWILWEYKNTSQLKILESHRCDQKSCPTAHTKISISLAKGTACVVLGRVSTWKLGTSGFKLDRSSFTFAASL